MRLFVIIGALVMLCGCATYEVVSGDCKAAALYATDVFADQLGYDVRIAYGITPRGNGHAQAQARIGGGYGPEDWRWLTVFYPYVHANNHQDDFEPTEFYSPEDFRLEFVERIR